jgi:hypothetical protein
MIAKANNTIMEVSPNFALAFAMKSFCSAGGHTPDEKRKTPALTSEPARCLIAAVRERLS